MRKRPADKIVVEQSGDLRTVNRLFTGAGFERERPERPAACYLVAWMGDRAVGALALESRVHAALIRCLSVDGEMRGRGAARDLIAAARRAARTRGARMLYAFAPGDIMLRCGFKRVAAAEMAAALEGLAEIDEYRAHPERFALLGAWSADISRDGVVVR